VTRPAELSDRGRPEADGREGPLPGTLVGSSRMLIMTTRKVRVLFLSLCATVVAVAIWVVVVMLNLIHWLLGDTSLTRAVAWALVIASLIGFQILFYRFFDRTLPR